MAEDTVYVEDARGCPQGELFLLKHQDGHLDALVYNTVGLNRCPKDAFEAIDVAAVAAQTGSDVVWKNPRRFWMMDHLTLSLVGEPRELGGLLFNFVAKMQMPADFSLSEGQSSITYRPTQIRRVSRYEFLAGRQVFLLRSPEETTWVMQTYTNHIDPDLTQDDLPTLGDRLALPEGWHFRVQTLTRDLVVDTHGLAHIVPDDLENMYQGYDADVFNFDPWE